MRSREEQETQRDLDGLVLNIELTLISIIQGVTLYFLVENSRSLLVGLQFRSWPYIASGLTTIFLFWSRSISHSLTVIRWPLEFGHNFLYITCTLLEAVTFTQIAEPQRWFTLNACFAFFVWLLFLWDLKLIRKHRADNAGPDGKRLYQIVERDQRFNICCLMPMTLLFNLGAALAIRNWPDLFLARGWHVWLAMGQLTAALIYLGYGSKFFTRLAPLIFSTRREWREQIPDPRA